MGRPRVAGRDPGVSQPVGPRTGVNIMAMRLRRWRDGWLQGADWQCSPNQNERPVGVRVSLAVIHSISLPPGVYGGAAIEDLFHNRLDPRAHPYFESVHRLRVSAHFVIRRDGRLQQFVSVNRRAWHAGVSRWDGREGCNDFSVGIELEGLEGETFEPAQYRQLNRLLRDLVHAYPLDAIAGHEHVAPGRKSDPGAGFEASRLLPWHGVRRPDAWQRPAAVSSGMARVRYR